MVHTVQMLIYAAAAALLLWFSAAWATAAVRLQQQILLLTSAGYLVVLVPILTWLLQGDFGFTYGLVFVGLCLVVISSRHVSAVLLRRGLRVRDILLFRL